MPLYEYECSACGERFEALVSAGEKDTTRPCPKCNSEDIERVPSTFAVGTAKSSASQCTTCCPGGTCGL